MTDPRAALALRSAGLLALLVLVGCMPTRREVREALAEAALVQPTELTCSASDRCAIDSPLRELAQQTLQQSTVDAPRHRAMLLEYGQDALLARIHMIRAAQTSIVLQSYIFAEDDSGYFVLEELLAAARRGVRVRVLLDQMFSIDNLDLLVELAHAHANFELRLYNPTFGDAKTQKLEFIAGILCCFTRFNQRMHNKLLQVDDLIAVTGGRNIQNRYFDWDASFNYRDRDLLLLGPEVAVMGESFDLFWNHRLSVPVPALGDVDAEIKARGAAIQTPNTLPIKARAPTLSRGAQMLDVSAQADSPGLIRRRLMDGMHSVGEVNFYSDLPNKPFERNTPAERDLGKQLSALVSGARESVLLQTPYLVLSRTAQKQFRRLQERDQPPQIIVSTNSLAATDAFPVYALSHKYKRRYLREFGFQIHEFKPYPESAPIDLEAASGISGDVLGARASESRRAFGSSGSRGRRGPLPLREAGVRISLHAKSMVIDQRIAMVGTHNFDPRSDRLNTESLVLIPDPAFAKALSRSIEHDMLPENAWTIARAPRRPLFPALNYQLAKVSELLPLFDVWPWRYATSWEIKPGCSPLAPTHPDFARCYEPVGDFPEVEFPTKSLYTRIITAFGAGLSPIL